MYLINITAETLVFAASWAQPRHADQSLVVSMNAFCGTVLET